MKATLNQDKCVCCGLCAGICSEVFRITQKGVAEVYGNITQELQEDAYEAQESCPAGVISIEE